MELTRRHTGIRVSPGRRAFVIINTIVLILISAVMLYPAIYVIAASFSEETAILKGDVFLYPVRVHVKAYQKVFQYPMLWESYRNTLIYTTLGTAINLTVSSGSGAQKTGHVYITLPNTGDTHTLRVYVANELQKSSDVLMNGRGYTAEISGNGTDVPVDIYIGETKVYDAKADFTRSTVPLTDVHTYPYASESTTSANGGFILPW